MLSFEEDILACINVLKSGGVILYPTDTIWGLGCDATNPQAVERIMTIKNRPGSKSMIVLVAEERDILQYVAAPDPAVFIYLETVQRPTTVIYQHALGLAENLLAADGSVGIRICREEFCRHLIKRFRKPIVSTSANISGESSASHFKDIDASILAAADHIVKYRQDDTSPASASSIISWENGAVKVIRP